MWGIYYYKIGENGVRNLLQSWKSLLQNGASTTKWGIFIKKRGKYKKLRQLLQSKEVT